MDRLVGMGSCVFFFGLCFSRSTGPTLALFGIPLSQMLTILSAFVAAVALVAVVIQLLLTPMCPCW